MINSATQAGLEISCFRLQWEITCHNMSWLELCKVSASVTPGRDKSRAQIQRGAQSWQKGGEESTKRHLPAGTDWNLTGDCFLPTGQMELLQFVLGALKSSYSLLSVEEGRRAELRWRRTSRPHMHLSWLQSSETMKYISIQELKSLRAAVVHVKTVFIGFSPQKSS